MENPMKVNLLTPEEVRAQGWQAETRDADGHLIRTCAPFHHGSEIDWLIDDAMEHGETVTIWPRKK